MQDKILEVVESSIKELNEDLGYESLNSPSPATELYGGDNGLDSLSLVMLVSAIEAAIFDAFGRNVVLASEKAMSMRQSPYRTVGTLVAFIETELAAAEAA